MRLIDKVDDEEDVLLQGGYISPDKCLSKNC
jgi:hypothetical protein